MNEENTDKSVKIRKKDLLKLYLLLIYGFNHMLRFNGKGDFNLPVGNVDFDSNIYQAITILILLRRHEITFFNMDYISFLKKVKFRKDAYVFIGSPYLISMIEHNIKLEIW